MRIAWLNSHNICVDVRLSGVAFEPSHNLPLWHHPLNALSKAHFGYLNICSILTSKPKIPTITSFNSISCINTTRHIHTPHTHTHIHTTTIPFHIHLRLYAQWIRGPNPNIVKLSMFQRFIACFTSRLMLINCMDCEIK